MGDYASFLVGIYKTPPIVLSGKGEIDIKIDDFLEFSYDILIIYFFVLWRRNLWLLLQVKGNCYIT